MQLALLAKNQGQTDAYGNTTRCICHDNDNSDGFMLSCDTCIAEGTPVALRYGLAVPIEAVRQRGCEVLAVSEGEVSAMCKSVVERGAVGTNVKGERAVSRMWLANGRYVDMTDDHRVFVCGKRGSVPESKPVRELKTGWRHALNALEHEGMEGDEVAMAMMGADGAVDDCRLDTEDERCWSLSLDDSGLLPLSFCLLPLPLPPSSPLHTVSHRDRALAFARVLGYVVGCGRQRLFTDNGQTQPVLSVVFQHLLDMEEWVKDVNLVMCNVSHTSCKQRLSVGRRGRLSISVPWQLSAALCCLIGATGPPAFLDCTSSRPPISFVREYVAALFGALGGPMRRYKSNPDLCPVVRFTAPSHKSTFSSSPLILAHVSSLLSFLGVDRSVQRTSRRCGYLYSPLPSLHVTCPITFCRLISYRYAALKQLRLSVGCAYLHYQSNVMQQRLSFPASLSASHSSSFVGSKWAKHIDSTMPTLHTSSSSSNPLCLPTFSHFLSVIGRPDLFSTFSLPLTATSLPAYFLPIVALQPLPIPLPVYDLSMQAGHSPSFLASSVAVHNCEVWQHGDCFPEHDTRILTNHGLLFLDEIEERKRAGQLVLYGCYDVSKKELQYTTGKLVIPIDEPTELIEFTSPGEDERWAEESGVYGTGGVAEDNTQSRHVSLRVTPKHNMFVQLVDEVASVLPPYSLIPARELLSFNGSERVRMLACAENGYKAQVSNSRRQAAQCALRLTDTQFTAFIELLGFWLGDGTMLHSTSVAASAVCFSKVKQADLEWVQKLLVKAGLHPSSWGARPSDTDERSDVIITDIYWCAYFISEFTAPHAGSPYCLLPSPTSDSRSLPSSSSLSVASELSLSSSISFTRRDSSNSTVSTTSMAEEEQVEETDDDTQLEVTNACRRLSDWMLAELACDEMRLLIAGLHRAADSSLDDHRASIFTSSPHLCDQLMQALLHCGYSAHCYTALTRFVATTPMIRPKTAQLTLSLSSPASPVSSSSTTGRSEPPLQWRISWTEVGCGQNTASRANCWPSLPRQQSVTRVPYSRERDGRTWCVVVDHPDHLIIAQRALRDTNGIVIQQSRPIVVGNCLQVNERSVPEQYFCEVCLPDHPIHVHNDSVRKSAINKRLKGKGKAAKLAGLSSPQVESRKSVEAKKKDVKVVEGKKEAVKGGVVEKDKPKSLTTVVIGGVEAARKKKTKRDDEGAVAGVADRREGREQQPAAKKARVEERVALPTSKEKEEKPTSAVAPADTVPSLPTSTSATDLNELGGDGMDAREKKKLKKLLETIQKMEDQNVKKRTKKPEGDTTAGEVKERDDTHVAVAAVQDDRVGARVLDDDAAMDTSSPSSPNMSTARSVRAKLRAEREEGDQVPGQLMQADMTAAGSSAALNASAAASRKKKKDKAGNDSEDDTSDVVDFAFRRRRWQDVRRASGSEMGPFYLGKKEWLLSGWRREKEREVTGWDDRVKEEEVGVVKRAIDNWREEKKEREEEARAKELGSPTARRHMTVQRAAEGVPTISRYEVVGGASVAEADTNGDSKRRVDDDEGQMEHERERSPLLSPVKSNGTAAHTAPATSASSSTSSATTTSAAVSRPSIPKVSRSMLNGLGSKGGGVGAHAPARLNNSRQSSLGAPQH